MKKLYTFLMALFAFGAVNAQAFTVVPSDSVIVDFRGVGFAEKSIYMQIDTQDSLALTWELNIDNTDPGWSVSVCDLGNCYFGVYGGTTMMKAAPGDSAFLKVSVSRGSGGNGSGEISYKVFDASDRENTEVEVHFIINPVVTGVSASQLGEVVRVFPNPAQNELNLAAFNGQLDKGSLAIYDLNGSVLRSFEVKSLDAMSFDIRELAAGVYFLRYDTGKAVYSEKFVKVN